MQSYDSFIRIESFGMIDRYIETISVGLVGYARRIHVADSAKRLNLGQGTFPFVLKSVTWSDRLLPGKRIYS